MTEVAQCLYFEKNIDSKNTDVMVAKNHGSDYYIYRKKKKDLVLFRGTRDRMLSISCSDY